MADHKVTDVNGTIVAGAYHKATRTIRVILEGEDSKTSQATWDLILSRRTKDIRLYELVAVYNVAVRRVDSCKSELALYQQNSVDQMVYCLRILLEQANLEVHQAVEWLQTYAIDYVNRNLKELEILAALTKHLRAQPHQRARKIKSDSLTPPCTPEG
jgi:hypothetical protein